MTVAAQWAGFAVGVALLAYTSLSVLFTLVVPRATPSWLAEWVVGLVRAAFFAVLVPVRGYRGKDRALAVLPPIALLSLLVVWLALIALGHALVAWPFVGGPFNEIIEEMTAGVLGLDYADGAIATTFASLSAVLTGVVIVALLIGYLPTLYGAFNQREQLVSLLESRAGAPAWGPELLARAARDDALGELADFYTAWEQWAADIGETHTSYPVLASFRSPDPMRSWIIALLTVLDAAALDLAVRPNRAPLSARLCLRTGFTAVRAVAEVFREPVDHDPSPDDPIRLSRAEFDGAVARMQAVGYPVERDGSEAWRHFKGWRVNYETAAYALADRVVAPPAPWSGPRQRLPDQSLVPQRPADREPG